MKRAYLAVLPKVPPGWTAAEIGERLLPHLPDEHFPGGAKAGWWAKAVQLDLEAKGLVARSGPSAAAVPLLTGPNCTELNKEVNRMPETNKVGKVKGPASYFPSIEKTYGKPIAHWMKLLDGMRTLKHMDRVAALKSEHAMGHGHANALVAHHRAQTER